MTETQSLRETTHVVQPGESVWVISEKMARDSLGPDVSNRIINDQKNRIIARNDMNRPGRNEDLIYPGEVLIIPPMHGQKPAETQTPAVDGVAALKANTSVNGDKLCIPSLVWEQDAVKDQCVEYSLDSGIAKMYQQTLPSVVKVEATRPGKTSAETETSYGSGFFVDESGLIATSYHVTGGFDKVQVTAADGKKYIATPVAEDKENDMIILKVSAGSGKEFPALEVEQSSDVMQMRQPMLIFGHPNGWDRTYLSEGLVNGATTVRKVSKDIVPNPPEENLDRKIFAIMSHGEEGNSGGPAVGESGKVRGLVDMANEKTSEKGDHIFITPVEPLNVLIAKARAKEKTNTGTLMRDA